MPDQGSRKHYRTIIVVEVLHQRELGDMSIRDIIREGYEGDFSLRILMQQTDDITAKHMAQLAMTHQSDPEFFFVTEDGEPVDDDERIWSQWPGEPDARQNQAS